MRLRNCLFPVIAGIVLVCGCSSVEPAKNSSPRPPMPQPTNVQMNAFLMLDLPKELAAQAHMPPAIEGKLTFTMESKAIQACPVRSQFMGKLTLKLADPKGTLQYVDFVTDLQGEYDGTPNEGLSRGLKQAMDVATIFYSAVSKPESGANTR